MCSTFHIQNCRVCNIPIYDNVIDLNQQYITSSFPIYDTNGIDSTDVPKTPVKLFACHQCKLLQMRFNLDSSFLYENNFYGYSSGINQTMKSHLQSYQQHCLSVWLSNPLNTIPTQENLTKKQHISPLLPTILDIGSNDGTTLKFYSPAQWNRIGIDPTANQFSFCYENTGIFIFPSYFDASLITCKANIISSICMFYDLPDPLKFVQDIYNVLDDNGIWTCEQSYLPSMLKNNSFDTICHEHIEYYSLTSILYITDQCNLKLIDISFNESNGGSFRLYFAKQSCHLFTEPTEIIANILFEESLIFNNTNIYSSFIRNCNIQINKLTYFLNIVASNNQHTFLYGASTKGNCLLQYANIDSTLSPFAVERNPEKIGRMTNTGIPIIDESAMRENPPQFLLVLPYHFKNEIIQRESLFLQNGGQLIFPLPEFHIYNIPSIPRLLITGCDGFIGKYLTKHLLHKFSLYGISCRSGNTVGLPPYHRNKDPVMNSKVTSTVGGAKGDMFFENLTDSETNGRGSGTSTLGGAKGDMFNGDIIKYPIDMNHITVLEEFITLINPTIIVHLAGIASSFACINKPFESILNNGVITLNLCDIIHRTNPSIVLFNASSSYLFNGLQLGREQCDGNSPIVVNDAVKLPPFMPEHNNPYTISKIFSHSIVQYYRDHYGLNFSNGVIATTESSLKTGDFFLNKVSQHLISYLQLQKPTPFGRMGVDDLLCFCDENEVPIEPLRLKPLNTYRNIIHPLDVVSAIEIIVSQPKGDDYLVCNDFPDIKMFDVLFELYNKLNINYFFGGNTIIINKHENVIIDNDVVGAHYSPLLLKPTKLLSLGWAPSFNYDDIINEFVNNIKYMTSSNRSRCP